MLNLFGRAFVIYVAGAFPLALFAAIWLDTPRPIDSAAGHRLLRRARLLAVVGIAHPVIALTSWRLAEDIRRWAEPQGSLDVPAGRAAMGGLLSTAVATGIAVVVLVLASR